MNNIPIYKKINIKNNNNNNNRNNLFEEQNEKILNHSISNSSKHNIKNLKNKDHSSKNTNHNTYTNSFEDNSNFNTSNISRTGKNMDTIEELHLAFVMMIQNTKKFMNIQENTNKEKYIYDNNPNSTIIKIEEKILN